jgi:hypothetical protein
MNETNEYTDYLKDVIFINEDDDYRKLNENDDLMLKNDIMKYSFSSEDLDVRDIDYFKNAYQVISQNIPKTNKKTDQWQSCVNDCYNNIETYMENEMKSTSYMLRLLTASVLGNTSDYKIVFLIKFDNSQSFKSDIKDPNCYVDSPVDMIDKNKKNRGICYYTTKNMKGNPFTGKWNDDSHFFNIGIMKNDKLLQTQNKKKETYLKIHVPKNNSTVIDNTIRELEQMEREYINTISPLQSPFYKSLWGEEEYSNVMNDINKKITRLPYLKYKNDRVLKPRDENIQYANKIIELLKLMKAFKNYTLVEQSLGIPRKDEENGNYYISSGVLYNGRDTGFDLVLNQKRGLPSDGSLFDRKQQDLYDLGINVNISKKLSDEEYRKIILDLIDALRKIKKNDNFDYNEINGNPTSDVSKIEIGEIPPNPFLKETYPTIEYTDESNGRFILGAGPSASGKTYNAGLIVKMMKMVDPSFPEFFMTIDGGTYRDVSVIYQSIIRAILEKSQYPGLKNLMSASIFSMEKSIFESDSIKKNIKEYLLKQTRQYNFIVSLYVPDTLAFCGSLDCMNKITPYIEITEDYNWIGLMIYQHKNGGNKCPFKNGYKCKGCTESGKEREKKEGKQYSSDAWKKSMTNGFISIKNAPNIRIVYHNNGGVKDSKSIFEDLSEPKIPYDTSEEIKNFFNEKNIIYINGELTKNIEKCYKYLLKGCKTPAITPKSPETQETSKNIIRIDEDFIPYYQNKYVGIPKYSIDIINKKQIDNINSDDDIVLLLAINNLITSGFLVLINEKEIDTTKLDDNEKTYKYYKIDTSNIDYNKVYDDMNTLMKNESIILYELEKIDKAFINFYENKYIGIDKTLDKNDEINKIMGEFIDSGVLKPIGDDINGQDLDENDRKYDYYKINFDDNIFHYFKDKDNFNTFIHDDSIIILDKEPNKGLNMWNTLSSTASGFSNAASGMTRNLTNKMFGVFNFTSLQKNGDNIENLQELQKLNDAANNTVNESDIDIIVDDKNDAVILNNEDTSIKITHLSEENPDIKVENITNKKGDKIKTVKATTPESSNYLGNILKSIVSSAAGGLFINKKNVDNAGNIKMNNTVSSEQEPLPSETNVDVDITTVTPAETVPFINKITDDNDIVINIPSKKKYIGVPKTVMTTDNKEKEIVNRLLTKQIMKKIDDIDLDKNLPGTQNIHGYNENEYDYYELNIDEYLKNVFDREKSMIYDELNILSNNNTLYIYEIEPEQAVGISDLSVSSLWNATKNIVSKSVGKMTGNITSAEKSTKNVQGEPETNNKPPKCNKKTTAKNMKKTSGSKGTQKNKNTVESETPTSNEKPSTFKSLTQTLKNLNPLSNKRVTRSSSRNKQQ